MSKALAKTGSLLLVLSGFCLGLVLVGAICLGVAVYQPQLVKPLVEKALSARGGRAFIQELKISLNPLVLTLEGVESAAPGLRLDRLEVRIKPWAGLAEGAWLGAVSLSGAEMDYTLAQAPPLPSSRGRAGQKAADAPAMPDLSLLGLVLGLDELALENSRITIRTHQGGLELARISARLFPEPPGPAGLELETQVRLWDPKGKPVFQGLIKGQGKLSPSLDLALELNLDQGRVDLEQGQGQARAQAGLRLDRERLTLESFKAALSGLALHLPGAPGWEDLSLSLDLHGWAGLDGKSFEANLAELAVTGPKGNGPEGAGLIRLTGRAKGSSKSGLVAQAQGVLPNLRELAKGLGPLLPGELSGLALQGSLPFQAALKDGLVQANLQPNGLGLAWMGQGVEAALSLARKGNSVSLKGPLAGPWGLGGSLAGEGRLQAPGLAVDRFSLVLNPAGITESPRVDKLVLETGPTEYHLQGKASPLGRVRLAGSVSLQDKAGPMMVIDRLDLENLGMFKGRAGLVKGRPRLSLANDKLDLAALAKILPLAGVDAQGWTLGGEATLEAGLNLDSPDSGWKLKMNLAQGGFSSADGNFLVDKLQGGLEAGYKPGKPSRARLSLDLAQGEALLKTVYLNLAQNPVRMTASAKVNGLSGGPALKDLDLKGKAGKFGALAFKGAVRQEARAWRYQGDLSLEGADLGRLFTTLVKEPFSLSNPSLAKMSLTGSAGMRLHLVGRDGQAALQGRVMVDRAGISREEKPGGPVREIVSGLSLDLPLSYRLGVKETAEPVPPKDKEWGRLKIDRVELPFTRLADLELPLALKPNRLFLGRGLEADFYGGKVRLDRITVERPLGRDFQARMSLELGGLDLGLLGSEQMPLEGELHGRLDTVQLGLDKVNTTGQFRGTVYGGQVEISNLAVSRPFSMARTVAADVAYRKLHLERLSQATGIGRITGRVSGKVKDLRVAYGQPVGFEMDLVSEKVKGVDQLVNLKAVNSISVLGTGAGLEGMGIKLMTKIFKEFPYKKIGIRCTLNNDVFKVRGLIREGGTEYLVKKPPLSGINVVNSNPDNRISFSDMKERLTRVTGSEEGPKVE